MAKSNIEQVIDTIIKNWNNLFSKLSKKKEEGLVVTADDVKPAVLEAGEDIYENNLTPAVVAEEGYKVNEFNEIYEKVAGTRINTAQEIPDVSNAPVEVNPIQLAAIKEAEPAEVQEIVEAIKENPDFVPVPSVPTTDNNDNSGSNDIAIGENAGDPRDGTSGEQYIPDDRMNTGESVPVGSSGPITEGGYDGSGINPGGNLPSDPSQVGPGQVITPGSDSVMTDQPTDGSAPTIPSTTPPIADTPDSPGGNDTTPPWMKPKDPALSYTLTKRDGTTEVRGADDVNALTGMIMADQNRGDIQINNEATFKALQGAGLIPAEASYQQLAENPNSVGQDGSLPSAPAPAPEPAPQAPNAPSAPEVSDYVKTELNKMFMQYTGRPADEADIAIHGPKITSGQYSLDNFRFDIAAAPEARAFREKTVKEFFRQYIGSEATPEDVEANSQIMANGETIDKTRDRFMSSPPAQAFHNSMMVTDSNGVTQDLYMLPPSDRDAAKNHIAGGGTFAQLENLGNIMNSGDPVAIKNWENFVANGGAMPAPPSTGNSGSGGGSAPAPDGAPVEPIAFSYVPSQGEPGASTTPPSGGGWVDGVPGASSQPLAAPPLSSDPNNPYLPPGAVPLKPTAAFNQGPSTGSSLPDYVPPAGDFTNRAESIYPENR